MPETKANIIHHANGCKRNGQDCVLAPTKIKTSLTIDSNLREDIDFNLPQFKPLLSNQYLMNNAPLNYGMSYTYKLNNLTA